MGKFLEGLGEELSLYVRQSAWLNTAPVPKHKPGGPAPERGQTRLERMRADGIEPGMPPIDAPHLIDYLFSAGPTMAGGMGPSPLSAQEIQAWQELSGIELQPWEFKVLSRLSREYLSESIKAEDPGCPAPFQTEDMTQKNRDAVSRQVRNSMRAYFLAKEQK